MKRFYLILMALSLFTIDGFSNSKSTEKKVVYDLTSGNIKMVEQRLIGSIISNSTYYQSKLQEYKVKVIVHGDAYKFFMKDLNNTAYAFDTQLVQHKDKLGTRLKSLTKLYAVEFEVCGVGVKKHHLNPKAFYPFTTIIHNAIVGLVDAQNDGYAYVPVN